MAVFVHSVVIICFKVRPNHDLKVLKYLNLSVGLRLGECYAQRT